MFKLDYTNVRQEIIGPMNGLNVELDFKNYSDKFSRIIKKIYEKKRNNEYNYRWLNCYKNEKIINDVLKYAEMVKGKFENIIIIGTGTILTSIQSFIAVLLKSYWNSRTDEERNYYPKIHILKDIDPDILHELLSIVNVERSLVITISGDATNPTTTALFTIFRDFFEKKIGENYRMHMVTITFENSILHQISMQENYKCFCTPKSLGFHTFSYPILLPLALVGIPIEDILKGQRYMLMQSSNPNIEQNSIAQVALIKHLLKTKKDKNITMFIPSTSKMAFFSKWYANFFSERLYKDYNEKNQYKPYGHIICHAYGNNDQRSLLQMMSEGPNDKHIHFIKVEHNEINNVIPEVYKYTSIGYLAGKTFSEITNAEIEALKVILIEKQRPNITLSVQKITPQTVGALMTGTLLHILMQGELSDIDPFDIPGEEQFNNYIWAQLGRYGYEQSFEDMQTKMYGKYIIR
jgi:glucose-6-phosphate isomerase